MFAKAGSIFLLLPVFFGEDPRPPHDFGVTVGLAIQDAIDIDSTKTYTLHVPNKLRSHPPPAWIYIGWIWSRDSISTTYRWENPTNLGVIPNCRPASTWELSGALILGSPNQDTTDFWANERFLRSMDGRISSGLILDSN